MPPDAHALPILFLINARAGSARRQLPVVESATERLAAEGYRVCLENLGPDDFDDLARVLPDEPSLVVACGGDGTVRGFAQAVAGTAHTLGVLPLGTVNVFARSLGLSMDLDEAIHQLVNGKDIQVDAARVNDRVFLNSFLLGLYPRLAALREKRRAAHAEWPKFLRWSVDSVASGILVLTSWRRLRFVLEIDGEYLVGKAVTFAVTNNEKTVPPGPSALDGGELVAYLPKPVTRLGMAGLFLRGIFTTPEALDPLRVMRAQTISVHVPDGTPITIDGEVDSVSGALELEILPGHCRVRAPMKEGLE